MLEEESKGNSLFTVIGDGEGRGSLDLDGVTLSIVFAVAEPFSELFTSLNFEERDGSTLGESSDGFLVFGIITVGGHDDEHSAVLSVFVEGFADLVESLDESVVGLGLLNHTPEGIVDGFAGLDLNFFDLAASIRIFSPVVP